MPTRPRPMLSTAAACLALAGGAALAPDAAAQATRPATAAADGRSPGRVVDAIAAAHGSDAYYSHEAVSMTVALTRGGKTTTYRLLFDTPVGRSRLVELGGDGQPVKTTVFDGGAAWVTPASTVSGMERFWSLTLPYFAAAPFKMRDASVRLSPAGPVRVDPDGPARPDAVRVTFDAAAGDAGDSPDDYYVLIPDDEDRLADLGYIVTYRPSDDGSAPAPHLIAYSDFVTVGGATFATTWTFYDWTPDAGRSAEPRFSATLSDIEFVDDVPPGTFDKPDGAAEDPLPARG